MCKREFWTIFSFFNYEIFWKKDSLQEFLFEPDVVNQISSHGWCKARFNKKDVDDKEKKKKLRKQCYSFLHQLLPQLQLKVFFQHIS